MGQVLQRVGLLKGIILIVLANNAECTVSADFRKMLSGKRQSSIPFRLGLNACHTLDSDDDSLAL